MRGLATVGDVGQTPQAPASRLSGNDALAVRASKKALR